MKSPNAKPLMSTDKGHVTINSVRIATRKQTTYYVRNPIYMLDL